MKGVKIAIIVLGVAVIILGFVCIFVPQLPLMMLAWIAGIVMIVEGITSIVTWVKARKSGNTNWWFFFGAVASIIFGAIMVFSNVAKYTFDLYLTIMAAAWLMVLGLLRVMSGLKLKQTYNYTDHQLGQKWLGLIIIGVIMAACGLLGLIIPNVFMWAGSVSLGIYTAIAGANIIAIGLALKSE